MVSTQFLTHQRNQPRTNLFAVIVYGCSDPQLLADIRKMSRILVLQVSSNRDHGHSAIFLKITSYKLDFVQYTNRLDASHTHTFVAFVERVLYPVVFQSPDRPE